MLVLTRRSGEGVWIGDEIQIKVLEIRGGQVKLGINAPEDKGIYRDEIYQRIKAFNVKASSVTDEDVTDL